MRRWHFTALGILLTFAEARVASAETLQELLATAKTHERSGNWKLAASVWSRLVGLNPTMPSYWEKLGQTSEKSGDHSGCVRAYRRALELGASYPGPMAYEVGVCHFLSGEKTTALLWFGKALSLGLRTRSTLTDGERLESLRSDPAFQSLAMVAAVHPMPRNEALRCDLTFLASELKRRHYSPFRKVSKEQFDSTVADLHARIPRMKDEEIEVGFMRLTRLMGDGHTYLRPTHLSTHTLPVQLFHFREGLFIIRGSPEHRDLVGLRVERIGGHATSDLIRKLDPIISQDNEMTPLMIAPEFMVSTRLLFGLGLIPEPDRVKMTVVDATGTSREVVLKEQTRAPDRESWQSVRAERGAEAPLYLRRLDSNYWFEYVANRKLLFFQYNVVRHGQEPLPQFLDRLFKFVDEHEIEKFVIDLRWNMGGTRLLNQQLIHRLIRNDKIKAPGKLFVVIGRHVLGRHAARHREEHERHLRR